mmetsp:Transcript_23939/g.47016  ORF Transcript_23939/g.47016 Transcript_23939/m.47016 type:complete len:185 (+) Transcript_23939:82-636(+)
MIENKRVQVDAVGACLHNSEEYVRDRSPKNGRKVDKIATFRRSKFCLVFENSITKDYVCEKVFEGLQAGCLPLTNGPANIREFLPRPDAALDFTLDAGGDMRKFEDMILELMHNETAYNERLKWKDMNETELSPEWRSLLGQIRNGIHGNNLPCVLCEHYAEEFEPSLLESQRRPGRRGSAPSH